MGRRYQVGDHVSWNSEAGRVRGRIVKVHVRDFDYKGHRRHASEDEPQYEIKSEKPITSPRTRERCCGNCAIDRVAQRSECPGSS